MLDLLHIYVHNFFVCSDVEKLCNQKLLDVLGSTTLFMSSFIVKVTVLKILLFKSSTEMESVYWQNRRPLLKKVIPPNLCQKSMIYQSQSIKSALTQQYGTVTSWPTVGYNNVTLLCPYSAKLTKHTTKRIRSVIK